MYPLRTPELANDAALAFAQQPLDAVAADVRRQRGGGGRSGADELPFGLRRGRPGVGGGVHGLSGAGTSVASSPTDDSRPADPLPEVARDGRRAVQAGPRVQTIACITCRTVEDGTPSA
jgi:hypothetical protein